MAPDVAENGEEFDFLSWLGFDRPSHLKASKSL
jgi:hypothetical protein